MGQRRDNARDCSDPSFGVLLEQTLGHVTHGANIRETLSSAGGADIRFRDLPFEPTSLAHRLPPMSNWTVRSGMAARSAVREMQRERPLDGLFVHTQVPATFLGPTMGQVPTIVSIDATPRQIDGFASAYQHEVGNEHLEGWKERLHARCFRSAAGLVAWSHWAGESLVNDYGVDQDKVVVIPPGVDTRIWRRSIQRKTGKQTVKILFVGGDYARKGGDLLVEAYERLLVDPEVARNDLKLELHLVTKGNPGAIPGVHVHQGLTPNSQGLIDLFQDCDVFCLPTRADCTPLVLAEAAAAGLPTVTTAVGAIPESIIEGKTGYVVNPDVDEVHAPLRRLVLDEDHRLAMGQNAAAHAVDSMDSRKNSLRILDEMHRLHETRSRSVLLTVSGDIDKNIEQEIEQKDRPLTDYVAMARATDATLLDWAAIERDGSTMNRFIRRVGGRSLALAHHVYTQRKRWDAVITDGEQVGIPLAAFLRFGGARTMKHVMIAHRVSPMKKALPIRALGLGREVDEILVYSSTQERVAKTLFDGPDQRIRHIDFMVDTEFFKATREIGLVKPEGERPMICAAGREFRDYPTLIEAVRGLDVDVVIASASPWSKRADNANSIDCPPNVTVTSLSQSELRDQLDRSDMLVMPLLECDFQAGITTILEAMSMERPVVCTETSGQIDVVIDGVNGRTVSPGDVDGMRAAILDLIANPVKATSMGKMGRRLAIERADVRRYAGLFGDIVDRLAPKPVQVSEEQAPIEVAS